MSEQGMSESTRYRIGAVARLTGISPDTLRIWERRYALDHVIELEGIELRESAGRSDESPV